MPSASTPVDEYLTALRHSLAGPRRHKADLLAEARDHLTDATEAFEADGLDREQAEREALADFGELSDVVPGYRAELAISQSRRTAMLLFLALIVQPIVWLDGVWSWNDAPDRPSALNDVLQWVVQAVGMLSIAGAVLAVIATGVGLRFPLVRHHVSRVTAQFALVSAVAVGVISICMVTLNPYPIDVQAVSVVAGFVVLPLCFVGVQAGRCLRLARTA
ncbi:permease prefix domain 1-containing protein [Kribbella sp. NPDC051587]|uniref:permease prefix domain 1-containing protein n=1 Tax=Kribbella sp. NPDC051587 TaxID=3364119 RepID=UPI0037BB61EA